MSCLLECAIIGTPSHLDHHYTLLLQQSFLLSTLMFVDDSVPESHTVTRSLTHSPGPSFPFFCCSHNFANDSAASLIVSSNGVNFIPNTSFAWELSMANVSTLCVACGSGTLFAKAGGKFEWFFNTAHMSMYWNIPEVITYRDEDGFS